MRKFIIIGLFLVFTYSNAQTSGFWESKEFSKEVSLFKAKTFLIQDVLKTSGNSLQFEAIPLAASSSGALTTLLYKCEPQNADGLILGFYGNYWDSSSGVNYQGYAFKNLSKDKAYNFLNKIETEIAENQKFLKGNNDNNNIVFEFDDIKVMIWTTSNSYTLRVYYKGFDSTWEKTSFERSKRRFERKI